MRQPNYLQLNRNMLYTFTRRLGKGEIESLTFISSEPPLLWVKSDLLLWIKGSSILESVARELTEEIAISRANGYKIVVLEAPLDLESKPDLSKAVDYRLNPLGKKGT